MSAAHDMPNNSSKGGALVNAPHNYVKRQDDGLYGAFLEIGTTIKR